MYCNVVLQCFCTYTTLILSLWWWRWWWWWWLIPLFPRFWKVDGFDQLLRFSTLCSWLQSTGLGYTKQQACVLCKFMLPCDPMNHSTYRTAVLWWKRRWDIEALLSGRYLQIRPSLLWRHRGSSLSWRRRVLLLQQQHTTMPRRAYWGYWYKTDAMTTASHLQTK